jgi:hypothetical protein
VVRANCRKVCGVRASIKRHCIRPRFSGEIIRHQFRDSPKDAVDESLRLWAPDVVRQFDRFVYRRVFGNVRQESKLKCSEVQDIPHPGLNGMKWSLDEWLEQGIECALAANHPEYKLCEKPAILGSYPSRRHGILNEFGRESVSRTRAVQHIGGNLPGSERHASTSGPKRMPSTMGYPRKNSSAVIRFFPAG